MAQSGTQQAQPPELVLLSENTFLMEAQTIWDLNGYLLITTFQQII